jgi:methionine-rich copper-binding protein CopC
MKSVVLGVLLVASLLACGTQGVTPQNNGNGNNGGSDTTAPTLTSSIPSNSAASIAVNSNIRLTFSEKMDTASVSVIADPNSDLGDPAWNAAGTELRFDPPANLETSSDYTLNIAGKDVAGNALAATSVQFTTAGDSNPPPPADTTAPTIVSTSPDDGSSGKAINSNILVTFSEAMNPGSVSVSINPSVNLGAASFKSANSAVEFNPPADLAGDTSYTVNVSGKDVAGNDLTGSSSFSFKTAATADTIAPGIPQNVVAEAGNLQIKFTWNANSEADLKGYTIYYGTNASNISTPVFVSKPNTSKTITGLTNGQIYYYQLEAEDGSGNRSGRTITKNAMPKDTIAPATPKNVVATAGDLRAKLTWTANTESDLKGYTIYSGIGADLSSRVFVDKSNSSQDFIGLVNGSEYSFQIEAEDNTGNRSARSSIVKATPRSTTPPRLTGTTPQSRQTSIPLNQSIIRFVFDKQINQASFQVKCVGLESTAGIPQCNLDVASLLGPATWSASGLTVTYTLTRPLLPSISYGFMPLGTDLSGNPLPDTRAITDYNTQLWFTTVAAPVRQFTVTVPVFGNGHVLRTCASSGSCDNTAYSSPARETVVRIGTRSATYGSNSRGYFAFGLSSIPANATIVSARLQIASIGVIGDPLGNLGNLVLERVHPAQTIGGTYTLGGDRGDYSLPALSCNGCPKLITSSNIDQDVTGFLVADQGEVRPFAQFRLRFQTELTAAVFPRVGFVATANRYIDFTKNPTLTITYQIP